MSNIGKLLIRLIACLENILTLALTQSLFWQFYPNYQNSKELKNMKTFFFKTSKVFDKKMCILKCFYMISKYNIKIKYFQFLCFIYTSLLL